jgi:hypothetical protein
MANWDSAAVLTGVPNPAAAGASQSYVVRGLTNGTVYYFAIRTVDEAGNWSGLSNLVRWDWVLDTAPPAAPSGLAAGIEGGSVRLNWTPNAEPDLQGYSVYRSTNPSSGYVRVSGSLLSAAEFLDSAVPPDVDRLYYEVTASDQSGNESARSRALQVDLVAAAQTWSLGVPYPNPGSGTVTFPISVVGAGAQGARLEILDAAGRLVRVLELGAYSGGPQLVPWDGRNESGALVAPGVYRARLKGGGVDSWVRLVRVP